MLETKKLRALSSQLISIPDDYMTSFRENVRTYIDQKEITLSEVAELADIPESTLKSFIYGKSQDCHLSTAVKLARVFKVSVDELVGCGTISPTTCKSLQTTRQLPESFVHFVRWAIHFHHEMLTSNRVTERAVEVMMPEITSDGRIIMTNDFDLMDISGISMDIRPKIFMGIKINTDILEPQFFEDDILMLANDRKSFPKEIVAICIDDGIFFTRRKEEIVDGRKKSTYISCRDPRNFWNEEEISLVLGYVVRTIHSNEPED